ncbi:hypothetical protein ACLOJK_022497 [Asimina triloba]
MTEYSMGGKASTKGDIYGYEILGLEMMTRKRPTDGMFENNLTLHHHIRLAVLPDQVTEIADPYLLWEETHEAVQSDDSKNRMRGCLGSIARIGVTCSTESPAERMKMNEMVTQKHAIRDLYLGLRGQGRQITNKTLGEATQRNCLHFETSLSSGWPLWCAYDGVPGELLVSVYHLTKIECGVDQPEEIWKSIDFQERESYDMLGISYENHPRLKRFRDVDEMKNSGKYPSVVSQASITLGLLYAADLLLHSLKAMHLPFPPVVAAAAPRFSNETDRLALLRFKDEIIGDPFGSLTSWNHTLHFCEWQGVSCGRRHPQRVTVLNLWGYNLVARRISPHIANLTFLRRVNLGNNTFHGVIPSEIGRLFRLRSLFLKNNTLSGEIPVNLTRCSELMILSLYGNKLSGNIPPEFGSLPKINLLILGNNNLTGRIPPSFGNLSSLTYLYLSRNRLEGSLPTELGQLTSLAHLLVFENQLSGIVPSSIYNLTSLQALDLGVNRFQGNLPPHLFLTLPNLTWFSVGNNQFTGPIPVSLPNATTLEVIVFRKNHFNGSVPVNLQSLQHLIQLQFGVNELGSGNAHPLSFLDSLTNCSNLKIFDISSNSLSGSLPDSIANLSKLERLGISDNMIIGSIPSGIGNLINLEALGMEHNLLTGTIPVTIAKLNKLEELYLEENKLSGEIPNSFCNMTQLSLLHLFGNNLEGSIPSCLENCKQLQFVRLQNNNLAGSLPKQLFNFRTLIYLQVQNNSLSGNLPMEAGHLQGLERLDISNNDLSGEIPASLGSCVGLEFLWLIGNHFQGFLPPSLTSLRGLRMLDVSGNNLSGQIPKYLEEFSLEYLNLSFNNFEGELPTKGIFTNASAVSVFGNPKLCGGIPELQLPACIEEGSKKTGMAHVIKIKVIVAAVVSGSIALSCFFASFVWLMRKSRKQASSNPPSLEDPFMDVSYAELLKATDGFSPSNLIGTGSYGSVYKGTLHQNNMGAIAVAVKVLNLLQEGALKSFMAECEALRNIRHRNLIKILTCCSSIDFKGNDFKALVFDYMPNGNRI